MKYFYKVLILVFFIVQLSISKTITPPKVLILLIFISLDIFRSKYKNSIIIILMELVILYVFCQYDVNFLIFFGILAMDLLYFKKLVYELVIYASGIYLLLDKGCAMYIALYIFYISFCISTAYLQVKLYNLNKSYKDVHDRERKYIYELESTKQKLLSSSRELVYLTEIKERNRIAREIHDNIGHSIAGIYMQLQAAYRLKDKDREKSDELLNKSMEGLSESLNVIRNTVHNIKPKENLGIEYIEKIINSCRFCNINFKYSGDFNRLCTNHMEIIVSNIKEALTNASKYSGATEIDIKLDITENYVRLYLKDNGKGCINVKEGLGISGMRERMKNAGGSISINGNDGFMIVCIIPINAEGGVIFENTHS